MMPLDPSIFARFAPKSVQDYDREALDAQGAQQNVQINALKLLQGKDALADTQRQRGEQDAIRNAMMGAGSDDERVRRLFGLGTQTAFSTADTLRKGMIERQKAESQSLENKANAQKSTAAAVSDTLKQYRGALDFIDTPQGAQRWLAAQYQDPALAQHMQALGPLDQAAQSIPQDPQGFEQWRQKAGLGMEAYQKQLQSGREFNLKANNELIGQNGQPNAPLIQAKKDIAKSGAAQTNLSVNTEKSFLTNLGEQVGKDVASAADVARDAQGTLATTDRMRGAIKGSITGPGSEAIKVPLARLGYSLGLGPANSPETLAKTREMMMSFGELELKAASAMKGQGAITENERALLRKAAAGDINLSQPEIEKIIEVSERRAKAVISRNKANLDILKKNPNASSVVPFLEANGEQAPSYRMPSSDEIAAEAARRAAARKGR